MDSGAYKPKILSEHGYTTRKVIRESILNEKTIIKICKTIIVLW
jgi:hypothetical protein